MKPEPPVRSTLVIVKGRFKNILLSTYYLAVDRVSKMEVEVNK